MVSPSNVATPEDPWRAIEGDRTYTLGPTHELNDISIARLLLLEVPSLQVACPQLDRRLPNVHPTAGSVGGVDSPSSPGNVMSPYFSPVDDTAVIIGDVVRKAGQKNISRCYVRAGPRATTFFDPRTVRAAIVTCGGLCPGLNNVIRSLVETLHYSYGVESVTGVQHGFWGFWTPDAAPPGMPVNPNMPTKEPPLLTPASVADIHNYGGTILGSDRGGNDVDVILRFW